MSIPNIDKYAFCRIMAIVRSFLKPKKGGDKNAKTGDKLRGDIDQGIT